MARGYAGRLRAFSKAGLLCLVLFSMVTWVPHACSCLRAFLFVWLPSATSALVTPKCLFVFSNIIVLFLAREWKLSRKTAQSASTSEDVIDVVVRELVAFTPTIKETHATEDTVKADQEVSVEGASMTAQQLDQCEKEDAPAGVKEEETDVSLFKYFFLEKGITPPSASQDASSQVSLFKYVGDVLQEEAMKEEDDCEEATELPTEELNRRVEDFIARFNMERQLEARMAVCCF